MTQTCTDGLAHNQIRPYQSYCKLRGVHKKDLIKVNTPLQNTNMSKYERIKREGEKNTKKGATAN